MLLWIGMGVALYLIAIGVLFANDEPNRWVVLALFAVFFGTASLLYGGVAGAQDGEPVEIWLVVDGTAIGTVKPGTFEYRLAENVIDVQTNELVYGCSQDRIFRDRYEVRP